VLGAGGKLATAPVLLTTANTLKELMGDDDDDVRAAAAASFGAQSSLVEDDLLPVCSRMLKYAHVCSRMLTYAYVCSRMLTYAHVCSCVEESLLQDVMAQLLEKHSDWKQRHGQTLALAGMLTYAGVC
jgi:hypothetical protein